MDTRNSQKAGFLNTLRVDEGNREATAAASALPSRRERAQRIPRDIATPANAAHPISVVLGPKLFRRMEKMGERPAAAMFGAPKLRISVSDFAQ